MTANESQSRDLRTIECIQTMFQVNRCLCDYVSMVQVTIEGAVIVLRGRLPSGDLKAELLPAIRRAGFLGQVLDCVEVESQAA